MADEAVYAIASGKGGVGKTTTTVNLGTALAGAGHTVAVVDADLGMANLAGFVSLSPDSTTLHEVLAGEASVEEATYELTDNIAAVPSGEDLQSYADVDATELGAVVDRLRDEFEYVLLDVGAGVSHETVLPLGLADHVVLVSTPDPAAVRDAEKTLDLTDRADGDVLGLVLTRTRDDRDIDFEAIASKVGVPLLGTVPEDDAVHEAIYSGTPVVVDAPESPAGVAYRRLAERTVGRGGGGETESDAAADDTETADAAGAAGSTADEDTTSAEVSNAIEDVDGSGGGTGNETTDADGPDSADPTGTSASAESDAAADSGPAAERDASAEHDSHAESETPAESDATTSADPSEDATAASADAAAESPAESPADDDVTAERADAESAAADADADTNADADTDAEGVTIPDAESDAGSEADSDGVTFAEGEEESDDVDEEAIPFSDREPTQPGAADGDADDDEDDGDGDDGFFGRLLG